MIPDEDLGDGSRCWKVALSIYAQRGFNLGSKGKCAVTTFWVSDWNESVHATPFEETEEGGEY